MALPSPLKFTYDKSNVFTNDYLLSKYFLRMGASHSTIVKKSPLRGYETSIFPNGANTTLFISPFYFIQVSFF